MATDSKTTKASSTDEAAPAATARPADEVLKENQAKGFQGVDSAEAAGGIDKLRTQTRERLERDGDNTGSTEPSVSPGHPADPTVATSTTAG